TGAPSCSSRWTSWSRQPSHLIRRRRADRSPKKPRAASRSWPAWRHSPFRSTCPGIQRRRCESDCREPSCRSACKSSVRGTMRSWCCRRRAPSSVNVPGTLIGRQRGQSERVASGEDYVARDQQTEEPVGMKRLSLCLATALVWVGRNAHAADAGENRLLYGRGSIGWQVSESLPPGANVAVLEGDPSKEGFFTMRIEMPDGYRVPAHWHPKRERLTILSGTLNLG